MDEYFRDETSLVPRELSEDEKQKLEHQNSKMVSEFKSMKLEEEAKKNWDIFYKNNGDRFYKDRNWTTREFFELISSPSESSEDVKRMLEVGCGVGNLVFPLMEKSNNFFTYCCDISPRAIEIVKKNERFDDTKMKAFQCDLTTKDIFNDIEENSLDIITMIFVLSAIHPNKFQSVVHNLIKLLKPGGIVLFRDYGRFDMAQLRFKPGNKIADNFYVRQDGTRSYYFEVKEVEVLFKNAGFEIVDNKFIHRRTINVKLNINVPRIFLQGKFRKPVANMR
ncbi:unnamed protein product [Diamesa serratosioi]